MRIGQSLLLSLLLVSVAPSSAWSATILSLASVETGTYENGSFFGDSSPWQFEDVAFAQRTSSINYPESINTATTTYTYRNENGIATYDVDWNFFINGEIHTEGYGFASLEFITTTDTFYSLAHSFTSNGGADRYFSIGLTEDGPAAPYFESQLGRFPYLGHPDYGNFYDIQGGSSQGVLAAGKLYYINALFDLHAFDNVGTSDGVGRLNLTLSAVPEPSSLTLCAIGMSGLIVRRHRRPVQGNLVVR